MLELNETDSNPSKETDAQYKDTDEKFIKLFKVYDALNELDRRWSWFSKDINGRFDSLFELREPFEKILNENIIHPLDQDKKWYGGVSVSSSIDDKLEQIRGHIGNKSIYGVTFTTEEMKIKNDIFKRVTMLTENVTELKILMNKWNGHTT